MKANIRSIECENDIKFWNGKQHTQHKCSVQIMNELSSAHELCDDHVLSWNKWQEFSQACVWPRSERKSLDYDFEFTYSCLLLSMENMNDRIPLNNHLYSICFNMHVSYLFMHWKEKKENVSLWSTRRIQFINWLHIFFFDHEIFVPVISYDKITITKLSKTTVFDLIVSFFCFYSFAFWFLAKWNNFAWSLNHTLFQVAHNRFEWQKVLRC